MTTPYHAKYFAHELTRRAADGLADDLNILLNLNARANMSKDLFEEFAYQAGLEVIWNKVIGGNGIEDQDALARFRKPMHRI